MSDCERNYYRSLYEAVRVINSSLEPMDLLNKIAEQTAKALEVKACSLRLLDKAKHNLLPGASFGLSKGYLRKGKVEVAKSKLDKEALQGKTVYVKDAATDPRFQYQEAAKTEGIISILVVPLKIEDNKIIGVMRVYSGTERTFCDSEVEFLIIMANLSAIAIENARLHQALKSDYELLTAFQYQTFED
ncbi:MAG: GAF domain-containing protein [Desulfovibrio sp.]|nr:GAF domain-containing protein [Desulfovibrio sp.]MBI4959544.1 GAF domain-containing protein [Desulfovibrio sp.]